MGVWADGGRPVGCGLTCARVWGGVWGVGGRWQASRGPRWAIPPEYALWELDHTRFQILKRLGKGEDPVFVWLWLPARAA